MIKAVLFDLDGTLLPMVQEEFTKGYFKILAKKMISYGYETEPLINSVWHGTKAMIQNDGRSTNEDAFWEDFASIYGEKARDDKILFQEFYEKDFEQARSFCGFNPKAAKMISYLKNSNCRIALATNPIFPAVATQKRIRWAGLEPEDFELYTTYENIGYCKPNLDYYREILRRMELNPDDCLMVGNDVGEDMVAEDLGMKVFLLTECVISSTDADISKWPHGDYDSLLLFLKEMMR